MYKVAVSAWFFLASFPVACADYEGPIDGSEEADLGEGMQPVGSYNGLDANAMKNAAILKEPPLAAALTRRALTAANLHGDEGLITALCGDDSSTAAMRKIAQCVLPAGESIEVRCGDSTTRRFEGRISLVGASRWRRGACDGACQEWVSACVIAHAHLSNVTELAIELNTTLDTPRGNSGFRNPEGTYFGDLFNTSGEGQNIYACKWPGSSLITRVCDSTTGCPAMTAPVQDDLRACNAPSSPACTLDRGNPSIAWDDLYTNCAVNGTRYTRTATVFQ